MNYGLPYKGSKNGIARAIVDQLPPAECFVDLFAGGCAVTHAALLSHKYRHVIANDIAPRFPRLFGDAIAGQYRDAREWVGRDDFARLKDSSAFVAIVYSYNNDGRTYLYSRAVEPYKRALHYGISYGDWLEFKELCGDIYPYVVDMTERAGDITKNYTPALLRQRRLAACRAASYVVNARGLYTANPLYRQCRPSGRHLLPVQNLEALCRVATLPAASRPPEMIELERLQRLIELERLQRVADLEGNSGGTSLTITGGDYRRADIPAGAVVYADPPYCGKRRPTGSDAAFDSAEFWDWAAAQTVPVYVSEYTAPATYAPIWQARKRVNTDRKNAAPAATENLYVARKWLPTVTGGTLFGAASFA